MASTGQCLCGSITYDVEGELRSVLHCHCENCRRATGNFVAATGCDTARLTVRGDQALRWFDLGYARYGFCRECGSHLFWVGSEHEDYTSIQTGSLNDASGLELGAIWFAGEAQAHHVLDLTVPRHQGTTSKTSGSIANNAWWRESAHSVVSAWPRAWPDT